MAFFEWGVAVHDLNCDAIGKGEKTRAQVIEELKGIGVKARRQIVKDYIAFPALSAAVSALASAAVSGRPGSRSGAGSAARRTFKATLAAEFHREHPPQRVGVLDHLLRPFPRPDLHVQPGRGRAMRPVAAGTCAS